MRKVINTLSVVGLLFIANSAVSYASSGAITITSIVQRANGVFFGVTYAGGQTAVLSAPQAQAALEQTCPHVRFAPGVMQ